jgi:hypothetical protein
MKHIRGVFMPTQHDLKVLARSQPYTAKFFLNHTPFEDTELLDLVQALSRVRTISSVCMCVAQKSDGDGMALSLSNFKTLKSLTHLAIDMRLTKMNSVGCHHLAELVNCVSLVHLELDLRHNEIGVQGAAHLAAFKNHRRLAVVKLELLGCNIGDEGVRFLAELNEIVNLRQLMLGLVDNKITDVGAQCLMSFSRNQSSPSKLQIDLYHNCISHETGQLLFNNLRQSRSLASFEIGLSN